MVLIVYMKKVNQIAEVNLLHYILNPSKRSKNINSYYFPILHACMNTQKGRAKFKNFRILLDSGCSSMIIIRRLIEKLISKKDAVAHASG